MQINLRLKISPHLNVLFENFLGLKTLEMRLNYIILCHFVLICVGLNHFLFFCFRFRQTFIAFFKLDVYYSFKEFKKAFQTKIWLESIY